jgi:hypothetical protein
VLLNALVTPDPVVTDWNAFPELPPVLPVVIVVPSVPPSKVLEATATTTP